MYLLQASQFVESIKSHKCLLQTIEKQREIEERAHKRYNKKPQKK